MQLVLQESAESAGTKRACAHYAINDRGLSIVCDARGAPAIVRDEVDGRAAPVARLVPLSARDAAAFGDAALLIVSAAPATPPILVDGYPALPLSVVDDRAELAIGRRLYALRAHRASFVHAFDGARPTDCALCKRALVAGDSIRRCRHCGSAFHDGPSADPSRPARWCHRYDPTCCRCGQQLAAPCDEEERCPTPDPTFDPVAGAEATRGTSD